MWLVIGLIAIYLLAQDNKTYKYMGALGTFLLIIYGMITRYMAIY